MVTTDIVNGTGAILAELFAYPHDEYNVRLDEAQEHLAGVAPDAANHLAEFAAAIDALCPSDREELFTRTFDINPVGALEIGWHLFGEDYHRGALLARLRVELRRHGIPETTELPDHLTHVLLLLDRMTPDEAEEFALACVLPALDKMLEGFSQKSGKENAYEHLLRCVLAVLQDRFGAAVGSDGDLAGSTAPREVEQDLFRQELLPIVDDWHTPTNLPGSCGSAVVPGSLFSEDSRS